MFFVSGLKNHLVQCFGAFDKIQLFKPSSRNEGVKKIRSKIRNQRPEKPTRGFGILYKILRFNPLLPQREKGVKKNEIGGACQKCEVPFSSS